MDEFKEEKKKERKMKERKVKTVNKTKPKKAIRGKRFVMMKTTTP